MAAKPSPAVRSALEALERWGLLLLQDPALPSLATLIAGERIRGSWWSHPKGGAIFTAAGELDDHPGVTCAKLVSGKVTFVHRTLFTALVAVGSAREPWQTRGLSPEARSLLARVDRETTVRASGKIAKELEQRLLVASREVHTESGKHASELSTWRAFARRAKVRAPRGSADSARGALEAAVSAMNDAHDGEGELPWAASPKRSRRG